MKIPTGNLATFTHSSKKKSNSLSDSTLDAK